MLRCSGSGGLVQGTIKRLPGSKEDVDYASVPLPIFLFAVEAVVENLTQGMCHLSRGLSGLAINAAMLHNKGSVYTTAPNGKRQTWK